MKGIPFEPLDPSVYRGVVRRALAEDLGWGDVTTDGTIDSNARGRGLIVVKAPCVLAGLDVAAEAFRQLDPAVQIKLLERDGSRCEPGTTAAEVRGSAALMLTAERTALNFLQRLSGIATLTPPAALRSSIRERQHRRCAGSKSTPFALAVAAIIATASTMGFSSRITT